MLLRWRYTPGTGGSPPTPAHPTHFPTWLVSGGDVLKGWATAGVPCQLGLQLSFSDQHSVWLMCKVPAFSWEVCASRLNGWFQGRATDSWILAVCLLTFGSQFNCLLIIRGYLLGPNGKLLSQAKNDKYVCISVANF